LYYINQSLASAFLWQDKAFNNTPTMSPTLVIVAPDIYCLWILFHFGSSYSYFEW